MEIDQEQENQEINNLSIKQYTFSNKQETIRRNIECLQKFYLQINIDNLNFSTKLIEEKLIEHIKELKVSY